MEKTMLNIKMDVKTKREAQKLAKEIGIPLSVVVNTHIKRFIEDRRLDIRAPLVPLPRVGREILKARADFKKGKNISPVFSNMKEAIHWLEK